MCAHQIGAGRRQAQLVLFFDNCRKFVGLVDEQVISAALAIAQEQPAGSVQAIDDSVGWNVLHTPGNPGK